MTLFDRVFGGNDTVYGLTEGAIDGAIAQYGEDKAVSFPNTAYSLPCYYAVTGTKVTTLKELKEALGVVKTLMTREKRLNDAFMSGVATALCAEFIEVLKYIDGATPYEEPCYGHLGDAVIRELGVPLVTGDIPGVAVILGAAPTTEEGVALVKSYQAQGILVTLVGGIIDQVAEAGMKTGANVRVIPLGKDVTSVVHVVSVAIRAALIFGNWRILPTLGACLLFGFARSGGYRLVQVLQMPSSYQDLVMILPYVLTLLLLVFFSKQNGAPRALGVIYDKGAR